MYQYADLGAEGPTEYTLLEFAGQGACLPELV